MGALYALTRTTGKITTTSKQLTRNNIKCDKTRDITLGHNGNVRSEYEDTISVLILGANR